MRTYIAMTNVKGYLTIEQMNSLIGAAKTPRDKLLIHLLSRTGRRVGELVQLRHRDIMFKDKAIVWHIEKKGEDATAMIPQDQETLNMLEKYIKTFNIRPEDYVFCTSRIKDKHLTTRRVFDIVRRYGRITGITHIGEETLHPHHFRHGFAIHFVKHMSRADQIFQLREIMQHSDIRMTMWYLDHFGASETREMMDKLF